jgi:hypothetical protein
MRTACQFGVHLPVDFVEEFGKLLIFSQLNGSSVM